MIAERTKAFDQMKRNNEDGRSRSGRRRGRWQLPSYQITIFRRWSTARGGGILSGPLSDWYWRCFQSSPLGCASSPGGRGLRRRGGGPGRRGWGSARVDLPPRRPSSIVIPRPPPPHSACELEIPGSRASQGICPHTGCIIRRKWKTLSLLNAIDTLFVFEKHAFRGN